MKCGDVLHSIASYDDLWITHLIPDPLIFHFCVFRFWGFFPKNCRVSV